MTQEELGFAAADAMAIRVGLHPALIWPREWQFLEHPEANTKGGGSDGRSGSHRGLKRLLAEGRVKEAAELHNAHLKREFERAKVGAVINLSDLMAAKEVLDQSAEPEGEVSAR